MDVVMLHEQRACNDQCLHIGITQGFHTGASLVMSDSMHSKYIVVRCWTCSQPCQTPETRLLLCATSETARAQDWCELSFGKGHLDSWFLHTFQIYAGGQASRQASRQAFAGKEVAANLDSKLLDLLGLVS